ncbi:hypothetical protein CR513_60124, partial [Mucuna pruriens]
MDPIVRVLRLVDNEKRPTMGYIYEAMDRVKEAIQKAFNSKEDNNPNIEMDCEMLEGLYKYIWRECKRMEMRKLKNGIPFNVARSNSFKLMIEAVGNYDPHLKSSTYHELRVPLLKKELQYTKDMLKSHEEERMKYRCSIIKNVIQVVTDNWSNYVMADLMLEDIGKIAKVKKVIQRGIKLVGYIYNHSMAFNTMRKFTNRSKLVRDGVTRFATTFLTLQRLHKQKANLRRMFTSNEWLESRAAKDPKGKKATDIVLMPLFRNDVVYVLKVMRTIVRVGEVGG